MITRLLFRSNVDFFKDTGRSVCRDRFGDEALELIKNNAASSISVLFMAKIISRDDYRMLLKGEMTLK